MKSSTLKKNGSRISSPEELVNVWVKFLDRIFQPTELEKLRTEFDVLPESKDPLTKL